MSTKGDDKEFIIKEKGPIWYAMVGVYSHLTEGSRILNIQEKRWKVKEILN